MDQRTPGRLRPTRRNIVALVAALAVGPIAACAGPSGLPATPSSSPSAAPCAPPAASSLPSPTLTPTASPPPLAGSPTQDLIDFLVPIVEADPTDGLAQRDLGLALLQRVRETGDPSLYGPAEVALVAAQELLPDDPLVPVGIGALHLGRHEFAEALATATAALEWHPGDPSLRGVVVDALVELGRYDEAFAAAESLAADSPDLASLARLSYAHELRGDLPAALAAMAAAAASPGLAPENTAYVLALVGHLRRFTGDVEGAADAYAQALTIVADHAPSLIGEGRLAVGVGDLETARERFQRAAAQVPLPEPVIALGETLEAMSDAEAAQDQYDLARALITLEQVNGVAVDVDLALFEADHGVAAAALELAETAYAAAPTVRAADARAWALHRLGRDQEAVEFAAEALRLGSRDPLLLFHAGAIAATLGRDEEARHYLQMALDIDPGFSPTGAAEAKVILIELDG
jgi:tetratricopeptide (TPR) repeat protein